MSMMKHFKFIYITVALSLIVFLCGVVFNYTPYLIGAVVIAFLDVFYALIILILIKCEIRRLKRY